MSDITQLSCLLVLGLGGCFICAVRELEAAFQLRRDRKQFIRDVMRSVQSFTERSQ